MDFAKIEQLVDLVSRSAIAELDLTQDGTRVRIVKRPAPGTPHPAPPAPATSGKERAPAISRQSSPPPDTAAEVDITVSAPMHGVFYRATAPGEPPFVEVGARIEAGQRICIIEAMKTFVDVLAETSGTVLAILVEDGDEIAAGQALFHIRPASAA